MSGDGREDQGGHADARVGHGHGQGAARVEVVAQQCDAGNVEQGETSAWGWREIGSVFGSGDGHGVSVSSWGLHVSGFSIVSGG